MNLTDLILLVLMVLAALWTTMTPVLLRSAIGLALVSVILTILMYRLHAPQAAVFELSVCTGLISVIFISTISLTQKPVSTENASQRAFRYRRYLPLPILVAMVGAILIFISRKTAVPLPEMPAPPADLTRSLLWNVRKLDLIGQILILLAGVYGVVILFKETANSRQQ